LREIAHCGTIAFIMILKKLIYTSLTVIFLSCAGQPRFPEDPAEVTGGDSSGKIERVVILGTNDIHGNLAPLTLKTREAEGVTPVEYQIGGAATLASYIQVLRSRYGDRLIWLDGGDQFQGTIESNLEHGAPVVQFFNLMGLNSAAVGNHEFDYGPEKPGSTDRLGAIKARIGEARYSYLGANIVDRATGELPQFTNLRKRTIINAGRVKVGVIGLSTLDTPTTTRAEFVKDLEFTDLREATLREAKALRAEGAHIIAVTAHVGLACDTGTAPFTHAVRASTDPQGDCNPEDELVRLLHSLPPGTIDAVVSGHSHQVVHHWIAGVPVIQALFGGRYLNLIHLNYDLEQQKLITDRTRIEGPVPVCPRVFQHQSDCNGVRPPPKAGRGPLVTPIFRGVKIEPDDRVAELLKPTFARSAAKKAEIIATAARSIEHKRMKESPLGTLVADAVRRSVGADVALVNPGGIRAPLEQGAITYGAVFQALPFDNSVARLKVTGKELRDLLRVAQSRARGYFPVSGVKLKIDDTDRPPSDDLNGNGRIEPWEINRLLEVRLEDGPLLDNNKLYTLATLDFLVTGGDNMDWAMSRVPKQRIELNAGPTVRDAFAEYLQLIAAQGPINSQERPALNPNSPRFTFVMPEKKKTKKISRPRRLAQPTRAVVE
jgi:5'-nucleotidase